MNFIWSKLIIIRIQVIFEGQIRSWFFRGSAPDQGSGSSDQDLDLVFSRRPNPGKIHPNPQPWYKPCSDPPYFTFRLQTFPSPRHCRFPTENGIKNSGFLRSKDQSRQINWIQIGIRSTTISKLYNYNYVASPRHCRFPAEIEIKNSASCAVKLNQERSIASIGSR